MQVDFTDRELHALSCCINSDAIPAQRQHILDHEWADNSENRQSAQLAKTVLSALESALEKIETSYYGSE